MAGNIVIGRFNQLSFDVLTNAPLSQYSLDRLLLANAIGHLGDEFDAAGVLTGIPFIVSQADIDLFLSTTAATGLPAAEQDFLLNGGWSAAEIDALGTYTAALPIELSVPTVTLGEVLGAVPASIPEPSSFVLLSIGALLLVGYMRPRPKSQALLMVHS